MKHFLVTRFNLTDNGWKKSRDGQQVLTDEWLEHRFRLFDKYCLPSVKNQSNQKFTWCIFFDINTPHEYKKRIDNISRSYNNFRAIFIDGMKALNTSLQKFITSNIEEEQYIITSRLDNDDLIHRDFIDTIQMLSNPLEEKVIDLRSGYQVVIERENKEIRKAYNYFNPFISLVETKSNKENRINYQK